MPRSTSKKSQYQARADELIRAQLARRKALIGAIGEAEQKYDQQLKVVTEAQEQLDARCADIAEAYNNAIDGGWTAAELKGFGINRPDSKPQKTPKNSTAKQGSSDGAIDNSTTSQDSTIPHAPVNPSPSANGHHTLEPAHQ